MQSAPEHENETHRLAELLRLDVLDTEDENALDELTYLASAICGAPISLISLIDQDRQWFKSRVGLNAKETPRELAFCAHAILQSDVFEVTNALEDARFSDNPLVTQEPQIRFYAGAPLVTQKGLPIGTLCVIDKEPRELNEDQKQALQVLAKQVIGQLELRLSYKKLQRVDQEREKIFSVIGHDLRAPFNGILGLSRMLNEDASAMETADIQSLAGTILESSLQVFQIIDELMQWTQQRLGRTQSKPKPNHLFVMVDDTLALLKDALGLKQLQCHVDIHHDVQVLADAAIVKTILRNIIANAIKYSLNGKTIKIYGVAHKQQMIVSIEDEGNGISLDVMNQLFKRSVESQTDTQGLQGSGIGLSLCAELVATQDGEIWVDKQFTQGARIQFSLPLAANLTSVG